MTGKSGVREAPAALPEVDPLAAADEVDDRLDARDAPSFDHEEQPEEVVG